MYKPHECIALLLAGGQGSRLLCLTKNMAKPAVPFGGKYRIIDFTLSNCVNSGIYTVGVLTQYEPHELNAYIGSGQPWDLDRLNGGAFILPPYRRGNTASEWYKGTANAVFQNIGFVDTYQPEYVLVLSGDHIYKMDYSRLLENHKKTGAACTISALAVSTEEASRFGIMNVRDDLSVYEFEEKPKRPKSNLASMGIYVFNWETLKKYLLADNADTSSSNDFGKNIIPSMLAAGERIRACPFGGYWKDVGTIESYWEANMDMLSLTSGLDLHDDKWKIYSRNSGRPPHYIAHGALARHCLVAEGCEIEGQVEMSVLFPGVRVAPGAHVRYSILMPGVRVLENAVIEYAIVAEGAVIGAGAAVGGDLAENPAPAGPCGCGITVIAPGVAVCGGARVECGRLVAENIDA